MISIKDKIFCAKSFDKRYSFPFSVVRIPYLDCDAPSKVFYSAFGAEILRSATTTNDATIFQRN